jgi:hypothetical protein
MIPDGLLAIKKERDMLRTTLKLNNRTVNHGLMISTFALSLIWSSDLNAADFSQAVVSGDVASVKAAIANGADPNSKIAFQHPKFAKGKEVKRPALMAAAVFGQADSVRVHLEAGARYELAVCPAVAYGHVDVVRVFKQYNEHHPNAQCAGGRFTPQSRAKGAEMKALYSQ